MSNSSLSAAALVEKEIAQPRFVSSTFWTSHFTLISTLDNPEKALIKPARTATGSMETSSVCHAALTFDASKRFESSA